MERSIEVGPGRVSGDSEGRDPRLGTAPTSSYLLFTLSGDSVYT